MNFMLSWVEHEQKFYNLGAWMKLENLKIKELQLNQRKSNNKTAA